MIRFRVGIATLFFLCFYTYGLEKNKEASSFSATYWMEMFSYTDYESPNAVKSYLLELRTGIPPLLSAMEIYSYNTWQSNDWIFKGLYQRALLGMLILPVFFTRSRWLTMMWCMGGAAILFHAIIQVHPGNPQYYDVLLPCFLLLFFLFSELAYIPQLPNSINWIPAFFAGLFLSLAELTRPFMLAILPFLMAYTLFHLIRKKRPIAWICFLLPVLLISGAWHAKLIYYNHGQIIWSNSSGTNLYRAWSGFVDNHGLKEELQEEAPAHVYGRWQNLNTQIHFENSELRKSYVVKGIRAQPKQALQHLWTKALRFIEPQTAIYANDPTGRSITAYKFLVNKLYWLFPFLLIGGIRQIYLQPAYFFNRNWVILLSTGFISLMPIIGESGEEARFVISVVPLLLVCGIIALEYLEEFPWLKWLEKVSPRNFTGKLNTEP